MAMTGARLGLSATAIFEGSPAITHVQLHDGAPGGSGTSNVASGVSRAAITVGTPHGTTGAVVVTATFTIPSSGGPYTHVSFWTASSAGTFCGSDDASPDATFANSGTLAYTFTYTP